MDDIKTPQSILLQTFFFLPFFFLTFIHAHIFVFGELEVMLPIYGALKDGVKRGRLRQRQKERKQERERRYQKHSKPGVTLLMTARSDIEEVKSIQHTI